MGEQVTYKITPKGMEIHAEGYTDSKCKTHLEAFQRHLAANGVKATSTSTELTPEAFAPMNLEKTEVYARK